MLLTRSRLCPGPKPGSSLHLHVLGTPPAFVLSQDQTLREELHTKSRQEIRAHPGTRYARGQNGSNLGLIPGGTRPLRPLEGAQCTRRAPGRKTGQSWHRRSGSPTEGAARSAASNLDTHSTWVGRGAHAVEFSKTAAPPWRGTPSCWRARDRQNLFSEQTTQYSTRAPVRQTAGRKRGVHLVSGSGM